MSNAKEIAEEIATGLRATITSGTVSHGDNFVCWIHDNEPPSQHFGVNIEISVDDGPYFRGIKYHVYSRYPRHNKRIKSTKKSDNRVKVIETFLSYVKDIQESEEAKTRQNREAEILRDRIQKDIGPHGYNITFSHFDENECFVSVYHQRLTFEQAKRIVDIINENGD